MKVFLVASIILASSAMAFANATWTCNAQFVYGGTEEKFEIIKGYKMANDEGRAIYDTSSKISLPRIKTEGGGTYDVYLAGWTDNEGAHISVRQICHSDWGCSFRLAEAYSDGNKLQVVAGNIVDYQKPTVNSSRVVVTCAPSQD